MFIEKLNRSDFTTFCESLGFMVNNEIEDIQVLKGKKSYLVLVKYQDELLNSVKHELSKYVPILKLLNTASKYGVDSTLVFSDFSCNDLHKSYDNEWQKFLSDKFPKYKNVLARKNNVLNK